MTDKKQRCKQEVCDYSSRWPRYHQCSFNAKKDGYCHVHHPDSVKAREAKAQIKYEEQRAKSPYVLLGKARERIEELERQLAEAHERIKYYESITTGNEHKAIDQVIQEQKK